MYLFRGEERRNARCISETAQVFVDVLWRIAPLLAEVRPLRPVPLRLLALAPTSPVQEPGEGTVRVRFVRNQDDIEGNTGGRLSRVVATETGAALSPPDVVGKPVVGPVRAGARMDVDLIALFAEFVVGPVGRLAAAMLRVATPLLYAALGETITERAGVLNLGIEGTMLIGAFAGFDQRLPGSGAARRLIAAVRRGAAATCVLGHPG